MRIFQVGSLSFFLWLVCSLPALSQNPASPAANCGDRCGSGSVRRRRTIFCACSFLQ